MDDISLPGIAHGVIVYSDHAHAQIKSIDTARALREPGVLTVLTGKDIAVHGAERETVRRRLSES